VAKRRFALQSLVVLLLSKEKKMTRITATKCICILIAILAFTIQPANAAKSGIGVVPDDAIACINVSNLPGLLDAVTKSTEWAELKEIEIVQAGLAQAMQVLPIAQLLSGMESRQFLEVFGHQVTFAFLGIVDEKPSLAFIFNVRESIDLAEDALSQLLILTSGGRNYQGTQEDRTYNDVSYNAMIGGDGSVVEYGFLDNLMIITVNDGFRRIVDTDQRKNPSIVEAPGFQKMTEKVKMAGDIYAYADLEKAIPLLRASEETKKAQAEEMNGQKTEDSESEEAIDKSADKQKEKKSDEMEIALMRSLKAAVVKIDLTGTAHEAYVHIKPVAPLTLFSHLLLKQHPPLESIRLLPAIKGVFVGLHIGDPVQLFTQLTALASLFGQNPETQLEQLKQIIGLDLKEDLLAALTGELGIGLMVPQEKLNIQENKLDIAKAVKPIFIFGIKDKQKFADLRQKIKTFISVEPVDEYSYKEFTIHRCLMASEAIAPGIALVPKYIYLDNLLIASNSQKNIEQIIDSLANMPKRSSEGQELAQSWLLVHADVGEIAAFAVEQQSALGISEDEHIVSEESAEILPEIGAVEISYAPEPEGIKLSIVSGSNETWVAKLLKVALIAAYAREE